MKAKISAMMDGELEAHELREPLSAMESDREARESWRTYHLISDALRGDAILVADCARRVSQRLAQEPALIGPLPGAVRAAERPRWFMPSALAASVAAVAFVGWVALAPERATSPAGALAPVAVGPLPQQAPRAAAPPVVPVTSATQDYLLAHQVFSPRNSLQGMAPYVRTVSDQTVQKKR
ncbi:MAG TPA: sigma-E factor negative regulatory protein [Burkholderiales bacterium]|jgi:sigma-E factor negative regulatory protein RseA|nr:sigma-E factor negative regulatory protein [Burkholderiales bacterium]